MMDDVGLDDIELVRISTKDLNRHLKRRNIDKNRQKEIKARRRTLKNRYILLSEFRFVLQPRESLIIIMKSVTDIFLIYMFLVNLYIYIYDIF